MFKPKPGYQKKWNFRTNNVSAVPLRKDEPVLGTSRQQQTSRVRRNLEEIKKKEEALNAKNRLLSFVTQKLLNNFGQNHKQTIAACVEAFFEVKNYFSSDDINGLESVIRESIRTQQQEQQHQQQQQQRQQQQQQHQQRSRPKTPLIRPKTPLPKLGESAGKSAPVLEHTSVLLQAISARKELREKAAAAASPNRNGTSMKNFKEGLDEQMMYNREQREKSRQQWLQEAQQAEEERERLRQLEVEKRERETARREELKRIQMQQILERRARDLAEREAQRIEDKRNMILMDQRHLDKSQQPRTASRNRSRFTNHKNLDGWGRSRRPSSADAAFMRGSYATSLSGFTRPSQIEEEEYSKFRQAEHAVFGLQPDSDHGLLESETYSSRASSAPLRGLAQRPASAGSLALQGVNAHTLRNALLARSAIPSASMLVGAGATGAPAAFYRHAAKAAQYANSLMVEEQQRRDEYERRVMRMDAQRADETALAELNIDQEVRGRTDTATKQDNKVVWLGAVEDRTREKKQWEEGMSPMERAINRGLLLKMKHYDRQRASSAPAGGRASPERIYSSHGALEPKKWQ